MRAGFVPVLALWTTVASAQQLPGKPIRLIVPFPAGSRAGHDAMGHENRQQLREET